MSAHQRGLIDTNIVILQSALNPAELPSDEMFVCAITMAELEVGPHLAADPAEEARRLRTLRKVQAAFEPIPFDGSAAEAYGRIVAAVVLAGRKPARRKNDLMIAAVALARGLPLFTTNPDDFKGLDDLVEVVAVTRPLL